MIAWSSSDVTVATVATAGPAVAAATETITIVGAGTTNICYTETIVNAVCNGVGTEDCVQQFCKQLTVVETADDIDAAWEPIGPF